MSEQPPVPLPEENDALDVPDEREDDEELENDAQEIDALDEELESEASDEEYSRGKKVSRREDRKR